MIPAQTIYCAGTVLTTVYSPWFPRGGDYGQFFIQVPLMSSAASTLLLGVQMMHKNSDETGDGTAAGTPAQITANLLATTTLFHFEITVPFKELVRYAFGVIDIAGSGTNWATFKVLPPVWFNKI